MAPPQHHVGLPLQAALADAVEQHAGAEQWRPLQHQQQFRQIDRPEKVERGQQQPAGHEALDAGETVRHDQAQHDQVELELDRQRPVGAIDIGRLLPDPDQVGEHREIAQQGLPADRESRGRQQPGRAGGQQRCHPVGRIQARDPGSHEGPWRRTLRRHEDDIAADHEEQVHAQIAMCRHPGQPGRHLAAHPAIELSAVEEMEHDHGQAGQPAQQVDLVGSFGGRGLIHHGGRPPVGSRERATGRASSVGSRGYRLSMAEVLASDEPQA